jgi:3-oxoadipate enol-lactonase
MPHIHVNGVLIYYELNGPEQAEIVVLNNGIFMNAGSWAFQMPVMKKRYRVLSYDMRGQGQSEHPEGDYTMELHADDLNALMDALNIPSAHMVGTSYGGSLNMVMALRHPARCKSLCIICSIPKSDPLSAGQFERWRRAAMLGDGELFFDLVYSDVYSEQFLRDHPDLIPTARQRYTLLDLKAATQLLECFQRYDIHDQLGKIVVPTCIAAGENDILKTRRHVEELHRGIPGSEFHVIANSGHAAFFERPNETNTLIMGWLAKQEK